MTTATEITLLPPDALDDAAALQARAFFDDPAMEFVFPDASERTRRLPWLLRIGITLGMRFGEVHTTSGLALGHAVWLPPGQTDLSPERMAEAGFMDPDSHMGEVSLARFTTFMEQAGEAHERAVTEPHWYLLILGVDPPYQGRGVGGSLLQPVLARADAQGRSCYLETAKDRNLAFYRRHGFEIAEEQTLGGGGPRLWTMVRPPR